MDAVLFEALKTFIAEQTGVPRERITLTTRLLHDLGMDGDDAVIFFEEFFLRFAVAADGFELYQHFNPEGSGCLPLFFL